MDGDFYRRDPGSRPDAQEPTGRIQGKLTDVMDDMDDASRANIRALRVFAEGLARDHSKVLKRIAKRLVSPATKTAGQ